MNSALYGRRPDGVIGVMLKLQFKDLKKAAIWLVDSRYSIGRDKSNNIVIDDEGISGFHAELRVEDDDRVFLTDAGSINGTFVNGKQIKARTQLRANDVISIHRSEVKLVDPKEQLQVKSAADEATAMTPALQGLSAAKGVGGVPTGWLLRAKTGNLAGQAFVIPASGRAVLGRAQNCDIIIPGTHVSRQHAELYFQSGKLHVKDLGSSNGTFVNRKKVDDSVVLSGDEIRFDTLVFQVESPEPAVQAETDVDSTQFRPAVTVAGPVASPVVTRSAKVRPQSTSSPTAAATSGGGSGVAVAFVIIVLALAGAVGWYFM